MVKEHTRCAHCGFSVPQTEIRCPGCDERVVGIDERWLTGGRR